MAEDESCIVCMSQVVDRGRVVGCGHSHFCYECLEKWVTGRESRCPTCRSEITEIQSITTTQVQHRTQLADQGDAELYQCDECEGGDQEEELLLCETCDGGMHIFCMSPPLHQVPLTAWICDNCANCPICTEPILASGYVPSPMRCDSCGEAQHSECWDFSASTCSLCLPAAANRVVLD